MVYLLRALSAAILILVAASLGQFEAATQELLSAGQSVKIRTKPIKDFHIGYPDRTFGKLTYLGGFEVLASDRKIGGLSGLVSLDSGNRFLAVTDNGHWVTGTVKQKPDGTPLGISEVRFAPLLGSDGKTLRARWGHDTEALTLSGSDLYVSAERNHAIYHYPWPLSTGKERMIGQLALPKDILDLPRNTGLESLASPPSDSSLSGKLIAIVETAPSEVHGLSAYILGPKTTDRFSIKKHDRFDATDADFLPNGDLLLMERRFNLRDLIGLRLRRFPSDKVKPDAVLEGELLLEANFDYQIDNMEAVAAHQSETGATILTLVSDNNRSLLQRTVVLRFRLED
ncbi:MAG: esterase-like activity of phytase family protein [Roseibium sp.]